MSASELEVWKRVIMASGFKASTKHVALALAVHAGPAMATTLGRRELARSCSRSPTTVWSALQTLENSGMLRRLGGGSGTAITWELLLPGAGS